MPARGVRTAPEVHRRIESTAVDSGPSNGFRITRHPGILSRCERPLRQHGAPPRSFDRCHPVDILIQRAKYDLYSIGLTYSLAQTLTVVHLSDVAEGSTTLSFTLDLSAKWVHLYGDFRNVGRLDQHPGESLEGLGTASKNESPRSNLGTFKSGPGCGPPIMGFRLLSSPGSNRCGVGSGDAGRRRLPVELPRRQLLREFRPRSVSEFWPRSTAWSFPPVVQSSGQPPVAAASGLVRHDGLTAGNTSAGRAPWTDFPGKRGQPWGNRICSQGRFRARSRRLPPATVHRQQQGSHPGRTRLQSPATTRPQSPDGLVRALRRRRFEVSTATAQIGTGFVAQAPLRHLGIIEALPNDALGLGVAWSRPAPPPGGGPTRAETVLEAGCVMQFTYHPDSTGPAVCFKSRTTLTPTMPWSSNCSLNSTGDVNGKS